MSATLIDSRSAAASAEGYELKITRVFDAPRELVWKAWTDPEMAKQWMGPRGFATTEFTASDEPGGSWHLTMEGKRPGSEQVAILGQGGRTLEIKPPELLKYTFAWDTRASVGLPESPYRENVITVRFEEQEGKTVMHFHQAPFATESERDGHKSGWNSAFDCFADFMLREQPASAADEVPSELHLRRFFAAPRQLVFDAWTKPELVKQWWGPKGFSIPMCEIDARQGGEFLIQMRAPDGAALGALKGRYVAFDPPSRLTWAGTPVDKDGNPMAETWTSVYFEEKDGGTEVVLDGHYTKSPANVANFMQGARKGWGQMLEKLAELVEVGSRK